MRRTTRLSVKPSAGWERKWAPVHDVRHTTRSLGGKCIQCRASEAPQRLKITTTIVHYARTAGVLSSVEERNMRDFHAREAEILKGDEISVEIESSPDDGK